MLTLATERGGNNAQIFISSTYFGLFCWYDELSLSLSRLSALMCT